MFSLFFFFNDTATTEIYTLSLHDALPIWLNLNISPLTLFVMVPMITCVSALPITPSGLGVRENLYVLMLSAPARSEEHTSELQSRLHLVCRLLLEKKKQTRSSAA